MTKEEFQNLRINCSAYAEGGLHYWNIPHAARNVRKWDASLADKMLAMQTAYDDVIAHIDSRREVK